jgi:capsular exopolysaccharide synthesis family protein
VAQADSERFELRRYYDTLRRRKLTIGIVTLGVVVFAALFSAIATRVYKASAEIVIQPQSTESVFNSNNTQSNAPALTVETEIRVLNSDPVRQDVRRRLGSVPHVSAARVGETDVMRVTGTSTSAAQSARIANAYAGAYVDYRKSRAVGDLDAASRSIQARLKSLQDQIDVIESRLATADHVTQSALSARHTNLLTEQSLLAQKLDSLQVDATLKSGGVQLTKAATTPTSPASPKPVRNVALALLVGLVVGTGLAFLRERLDDTVRTKDELASALPDVSVLGLVPIMEGWDRDPHSVRLRELAQGGTAAAEAFRDLRTSVQLLGVERPLRIVQVTSPSPSDGKTTVVAGLASVLAAPGNRVLVVDCDLRRPQVHTFFGLSNDKGFCSIFTDDLAPLDLIQRVQGEESLYVLSSGPVPPNPSELLSSRRTSEALFELKHAFDIVLVDSPPVLPVTDTVLLAAWVEGTIVVARSGATTAKHLSETVERLRRAAAPVVGTVLNKADEDATEGYSYGYHYSEEAGERR